MAFTTASLLNLHFTVIIKTDCISIDDCCCKLESRADSLIPTPLLQILGIVLEYERVEVLPHFSCQRSHSKMTGGHLLTNTLFDRMSKRDKVIMVQLKNWVWREITESLQKYITFLCDMNNLMKNLFTSLNCYFNRQ